MKVPGPKMRKRWRCEKKTFSHGDQKENRLSSENDPVRGLPQKGCQTHFTPCVFIFHQKPIFFYHRRLDRLLLQGASGEVILNPPLHFLLCSVSFSSCLEKKLLPNGFCDVENTEGITEI